MEESNIYQIVPVEFGDDWDEKQQLKAFLEANPNHYFKGKELSKRCGFKNSATSVYLRKAVTELICIEKFPVVADSHGFMHPTRKVSVDYYIARLNDRVMGINRRIAALRQIKEGMGD